MTPDEARRAIHDAEDLRSNLPADCWRALETIAGMREEWGVMHEYRRRDGHPAHACRWVDTDGSRMDHHAARRIADRKKRDGCDNVRLVRRYVTTPEEIE